MSFVEREAIASNLRRHEGRERALLIGHLEPMTGASPMTTPTTGHGEIEMSKLITSVALTSLLASSPIAGLASVDEAQLKQDCREEAKEEGLSGTEMADYIAECVSEAMERAEPSESEETPKEETEDK